MIVFRRVQTFFYLFSEHPGRWVGDYFSNNVYVWRFLFPSNDTLSFYSPLQNDLILVLLICCLTPLSPLEPSCLQTCSWGFYCWPSSYWASSGFKNNDLFTNFFFEKWNPMVLGKFENARIQLNLGMEDEHRTLWGFVVHTLKQSELLQKLLLYFVLFWEPHLACSGFFPDFVFRDHS